MENLPLKLGKEPLVDVGFELRFASTQPASNLLPGILVAKLGDSSIVIERLSTADIPSNFREADPALKYMPLVSMTWGNYIIGISDSSLSVSCLLPYLGWQDFKAAIQKVIQVIDGASYITALERHSMKYVDLLEIDDVATQIKAVNLGVTVGGHALSQEAFRCRMDIPENDFTKIIQILTNAAVIISNRKRSGIVVDVDIVRPLAVSVADYLRDLPDSLDAIHAVNKKTFFSCLTKATVEALEPIYE